jgi:hypothetical protein
MIASNYIITIIVDIQYVSATAGTYNIQWKQKNQTKNNNMLSTRLTVYPLIVIIHTALNFFGWLVSQFTKLT